MNLSKLNNNTQCEQVSVNDMETLAQLITLTNWAPGVFKTNYRNLTNFESTDVLALDIDKGCTLEEAQKLFADYECVIATTRSHQKEKNGVTCDRFRVVLKLEYPITNANTYTSTYLSVAVLFPFVDLACADASRQFFQSMYAVTVQSTGKTIQPVDKGALAKSTIEFMAKEVAKGEWNPRLFKAAKDFQQQHYSYDEAVAFLKRPTGHLDNKDLATIASAYKNENKHLARIEDPTAPTPERWVGEWIIARKLDINYNEEIILDGKAMNYSQIEDRLLLDTAKTGYKFPEKLLFAALRVYYDDAIDNIVADMRRKMSYAPSEIDHVKEFVTALEGQSNELSEAVVRHFVWQVKRKLNGMPVDHHLMPILVGPTNGGKSEALQRLIAPLTDMAIGKQLNVVNDERQLFNFSRYFIVYFDEMSNSSKTDVDCLKNTITSPYIAYRMMRQNKNSNLVNTATFIGASNNEIKHIINDPTSARRFYQIDCQKLLPWDTVNKLNYLALWKSVDENAPAPIKPFLSQLKHKQEEFRQLSVIEEFIQMRCDIVPEEWTKGDDLVREYNDWVKLNNIKASYRPMRILSELGKLVDKKRMGNVRYYAVKVKNEFTPQ